MEEHYLKIVEQSRELCDFISKLPLEEMKEALEKNRTKMGDTEIETIEVKIEEEERKIKSCKHKL